MNSITTKSGRVYSTKKLKVHRPTKVVTGKFKSALSDYYKRKIIRLQKEIINAKLALIDKEDYKRIDVKVKPRIDHE